VARSHPPLYGEGVIQSFWIFGAKSLSIETEIITVLSIEIDMLIIFLFLDSNLTTLHEGGLAMGYVI